MEKATVLEYMRIKSLVGFEWTAQYIADVTNVYLSKALTPEYELSAVQRVIAEMAELQQKRERITAEMVRDLLIKSLENNLNVFDTPKAAKKLPLPKNEQPLSQNELAQRLREAELQKYSAELQRYHLRERNIQFVGRLVNAVKELDGWFHWVSAGPAEGTFRPSETTSKGANHFAYWLNGGGNEPDCNANMNCWEAVFFAAYKAGLVNLLRLRLIHGKATLAARAKTGAAREYAYFDSLTDSLGYQNSFPFVPSVGLCPSPGDILFFDRDEHVALCMETGVSIIVMSHWKLPKHGFHRYDIDEFTLNRVVRFGSMPL